MPAPELDTLVGGRRAEAIGTNRACPALIGALGFIRCHWWVGSSPAGKRTSESETRLRAKQKRTPAGCVDAAEVAA
jgi:hypothetical protein